MDSPTHEVALEEQEAVTLSPEGEESRGRERSRVGLPYYDLDTSISIAREAAVHGGQDVPIQEIKEDDVTLGTYRVKLASAQLFGLIEFGAELVSLTPLGYRVLDSEQQPRARAEAFVSVPLYAHLYSNYVNRKLPSDYQIERVMESIGVPPKQTSRARRNFLRSAEQAGLFETARDMLVSPDEFALEVKALPVQENTRAVTPRPSRDQRAIRQVTRTEGAPVSTGQSAQDHKLLQGLLETLPPLGTVWPASERDDWLELARLILKRLYRDSDVIQPVHGGRQGWEEGLEV